MAVSHGKGRSRPLNLEKRTNDMTNEIDNRVLGRKGARMLSNEEVLNVGGGSGTLKFSHLPNGEVDVLADS
jgi:hypothetical protein